MKFADLPDAKLKSIAKDMNAQVFYSECIGPNDYHNLAGAVNELENRGYKVAGKRKLKFQHI